MNSTVKNLKVMRVGMTYPSDIAPGIGLHAYYYSLYSQHKELILTIKRPGIKPENRSGVKIIEIKARERKLARYSESALHQIVTYILKIKDQLFFLNSSKKYIREFNPDIIHVFSPIPIICGIYAKKKCNSKIVMSLHGSDALRIGKHSFLKFLLKIPDAIVVVGEDMISMLPEVSTRYPIKCIGNGVDTKVFNNKHLKRSKQFIHVANLRWQKGQQYLLEGFAMFHKNHMDYKLVIIGDGEEYENLINLCKNLNIIECVEFKKTRGREYIANELNKSIAFVLTSISEGFPKVIIEAMATGTPVISSDVGNVKRVVGSSGIIFPMKDSLAVCDSMEKIIQTENWLQLSSEAEQIASQYSWEKVVEKLDEIYYDITEE